MALHKDEAFVLFKRAYGESDKIIRLFTRASGKIGAIAKGANRSQKRFMNTLEPFNHINVEYFEKYDKGMVRLENADIIETNSGIETSLKKACVASFFTELVDRLTKEKEPHESLFSALRELLFAVKNHDFIYSDILYYQFIMLDMLGYMPNFDSCVYCGSTMTDDKKVHFSKERGGVLCVSCSKSIPHTRYGEGVIPGLALIGNQKKPLINMIFERQAQDIMEDFMSFHLDVEFRSYRILKKVIS
jgi:DNA repair protein RecO (recombination protein O)